jgi:hypothetical protein
MQVERKRSDAMTITVSINGNKLFAWTGDAEDAEGLDEGMKEVARQGPPTLKQIVDRTVAHVLNHGGFGSERWWMQPTLLWMLLSQPTSCPDRPGLYRDYVEAWDFDFDICNDDKNPRLVHIDVIGKRLRRPS